MIGWMMCSLGKIIFVIVLVSLASGCIESTMYDNSMLDALLEATSALSAANVASAPVNPYVLPIGVGLSGLVGIIEALRRKEKSARKHAEQKLNGNNDHT